MKKHIILFLFFLSFSVKSQTEKIEKEITINSVEYIEDIKIDNNNFYVAGFTFKVSKPDGYSTNSLLGKYDKNLKLLWNLKLNLTSKSEINKLEVFDNKIYALVKHGKNTNTTTETYINLYVISMNGKIIEKIKIGNCYSNPTNILIEKNKLWFAYPESSSKYYSTSNIIKTILVEYNLKTKKVIKKEGNTSSCFPQKIISKNSDIYIFGRFEKVIGDLVSEHFVLKFEKNLPNEVILHTEKSEYFLDAYQSDEEFVILTTFPGVYGDLNKYIKYSYFNIKNKIIKEKIIYFKDNKWTDIKFETYNEVETTWLIIKHNNSNEYYTQLNKKGEVISEISLEKIGNNIDKFIIQKDYQIQNAGNQIKLTNELRN